MKKTIILLMTVLLVVLCTDAQALKLCEDNPDKKITTQCTMVTPKLTGCTPYVNYSIFNISGDNVESGNLTSWGGGMFYFNFSLGKGEYVILLCDGGTREVVAEAEKDEMASLSVTFLVLLITVGVFALPRLVGRFSKSDILNTLLKGLCIVFGLLLLSLNVVMVVTMADEADLGVSTELFRYLWIINWATYLAMLIVTLTFGYKILQLWNIKKAKREFGEE